MQLVHCTIAADVGNSTSISDFRHPLCCWRRHSLVCTVLQQAKGVENETAFAVPRPRVPAPVVIKRDDHLGGSPNWRLVK